MFGITDTANAWLGLLALLVIIVLLAGIVVTVKQKRGAYRFIERRFLLFSAHMHEMLSANVKRSGIAKVTLSTGVEGCVAFCISIWLCWPWVCPLHLAPGSCLYYSRVERWLSHPSFGV